MSVKPVPDGFHTVTPYLLVEGAADFITFLKNAFNAEERDIHTDPDGQIVHAEIQIGDSIIMTAEATEKYPPMPAMIYLYVEDTDKVYQSAIKAGAVSDMEPEDKFYGDRNAGVRDPFGNYWSISTHIKDISAAEMQRIMEEKIKEKV